MVSTDSRRDPAVTSRMMAAVRNKDSKAELALRSALHRRGRRFRLHAKDLPGRPDVIFRSSKLAVFVDGDFWHGNAWRLRGLSSLEAQFPNRTDWWSAKIRRTIERDRAVDRLLLDRGWSVLRIWESEILNDPHGAAARVETELRKLSTRRTRGN
jgi:DNA mismatch endonuclease (patch repair protein)